MVPSSTGVASFVDRYGWDRPGAMAGGMSTTSSAALAGVGGSAN